MKIFSMSSSLKLHTDNGKILQTYYMPVLIAYSNGIEVARYNKKWTEVIDISDFANELFPNNNTLDIECLKENVNSDSFLFVPFLLIQEE